MKKQKNQENVIIDKNRVFISPNGEKKVISPWGKINPMETAKQLDADMVQVPAGACQFGLSQTQRQEMARRANVHPDMLCVAVSPNLPKKLEIKKPKQMLPILTAVL